ncbi:MAG: hypothetical protein KJP00_03510 [Bacteroidia bacterium]|nr:hypothetical protein [Bacteroidia bacterium]
MTKDLNPKDKEIILKDFEIESTHEDISEEELLDLLTEQVAYLIDRRLDFLLSLLYRLDIEEKKIKVVLYNQDLIEPARGLAQLILDRQKERNRTKEKYKTEGDGTW